MPLKIGSTNEFSVAVFVRTDVRLHPVGFMCLHVLLVVVVSCKALWVSALVADESGGRGTSVSATTLALSVGRDLRILWTRCIAPFAGRPKVCLVFVFGRRGRLHPWQLWCAIVVAIREHGTVEPSRSDSQWVMPRRRQ
jgi:hypothetical protein